MDLQRMNKQRDALLRIQERYKSSEHRKQNCDGPASKAATEPAVAGLNIYNMAGAFGCVALGLCVATVTAFAECAYRRRGRPDWRHTIYGDYLY